MSRRTTLRAIAALLPEEPQTPTPERRVGVGRSIPRNALVRGGLLLAGSVIIVGLFLTGGRSSPSEAPTPLAAPVQATVAPNCPSVASFVDVITTYERQARWGLAASTAQTALRTAGLCTSDRAALAQKLVGLDREALFERPPAPEDAPGQRRVATAYADLKTLATQDEVQPPPPLLIAQTAY